MKFTIFILITAPLLITQVSSLDPQQTTTTETITTTTTEHPKINITTSSLCKRCHCDAHTKTLDCSRINLSTFFTKDDLDVLRYGDIQFETIRMDHNNLQAVPPFPALQLKRLYINNNKIDKIEKSAFKELTQLEVLDLSHNQLTSKALFPAVFEGKYNPTLYEPLGHLKELNLGNNQLHSLDPDVFEHFPNLESLSLDSNPFHVIDHLTEIAISSLWHIKTLDLSYMQLSELPPHLLHAPKNLENLLLTGNLFTMLPKALAFAVNLKKLNLDENLFKELSEENVFPRLEKLEILSISYLPDLEKIGKGAFSQLQNLKELVATNNPMLSYLEANAFCRGRKNETTFDFPPLEKLFLHNNNLTLLEKTLLERWDKLNTIDIRENPWRCDCENHWMIHTLYPQILQSTPVLSHGIVCSYPPEWKDVPINDIHEKKKNLRCTDIYGNNPSKDGAVLIGIMIGLLIGIPLTFAAIIMYRRGCYGLLSRAGPGEYSRAFYKRASNIGEEY